MAAQHSQSLESWFVHTPGLVVVMPSTPYDAKGLLKSAIRDDNPVVFLERRLHYGRLGPVPKEEYTLPIGVADVKRVGTDVTVVAYSGGVQLALQAGRGLAREGIEIEVIDLRTLKPLDLDAIVASLEKTRRLVVVSEGARAGGFASEVVARVTDAAWHLLDSRPVRVTAKDTPMPFAAVLEREVLPQVADVVAGVKAALAPDDKDITADNGGSNMSVPEPAATRAADFEVPAGFVESLFGLGGRVACVTGGGSGIGAAIAKGLAQAGARIVVIDIDDDGAAATVATIAAQGGKASARPLRRHRPRGGRGDGRRDRRRARRRSTSSSTAPARRSAARRRTSRRSGSMRSSTSTSRARTSRARRSAATCSPGGAAASSTSRRLAASRRSPTRAPT